MPKPPHATRLGILVSGRGSNLNAILGAIADGRLNARVMTVISDREDIPAIEIAKQHCIPVVTIFRRQHPTQEAFERAILLDLTKARVELVCLAGFMRLIGPTLLRAFHHRIMNIHPSLLPAFPGLRAQRQALDHGVKVSGCTVHLVDDQCDHGPIILQQTVELKEADTEESLAARILVEEHRLYPKAIQLFAENKLRIKGRIVHIQK